MINVFQPSLREEELAAVGEVFQSNWIGRGKRTAHFEERFAEFLTVDRRSIRSINNCTEGLFQSMAFLEIGRGDEVILPTISFVGAGNAVAASGARPVFCDVDRRTLNARASDIEAKLTDRTKAVLLLHYGGLPCELDEICALLEGRDIALIEDSACSVASRYKGRACGTIGDIGVWSFDAMKILVTGDGGMLYLGDPALREVAEEQLYLGLLSKSGFTSDAETRWWEFDISRPSRRTIINDITAAIGIEQLKKLPQFIARRKEVHSAYDTAFGDLEWLRVPPPFPEYVESSYYFYWVQADTPEVRDELSIFLKDRDIYTTFRYYPLHRVACYGATDAALPNADAAADITLCIPIHQDLADLDVDRVIDAIRAFGQSAQGTRK